MEFRRVLFRSTRQQGLRDAHLPARAGRHPGPPGEPAAALLEARFRLSSLYTLRGPPFRRLLWTLGSAAEADEGGGRASLLPRRPRRAALEVGGPGSPAVLVGGPGRAQA